MQMHLIQLDAFLTRTLRHWTWTTLRLLCSPFLWSHFAILLRRQFYSFVFNAKRKPTDREYAMPKKSSSSWNIVRFRGMRPGRCCVHDSLETHVATRIFCNVTFIYIGAAWRIRTIYDNLIDFLHVSLHSLPTSCRAPPQMSFCPNRLCHENENV